LVTRLWGLLASPIPINEEQKTNARKLSVISCELKYSAVAYKDKGGREKRESYGRY
jgi:hypothetical protein